jgi:signal transduction histidine kinase
MKSGMGLGLDGLKLWRTALTKPARRAGGWPSRWPLFTSLRSQLIIPYVVLTLLTAMIGTYIVTRLVTSSVRERFVNQLHEAGRVAADGIVRRERAHLDNLRLMVFTQGVAPALQSRDAGALQRLLGPLTLNNNVEALSVFDRSGQEILTLVHEQVISSGTNFSHFDLVAKVITGQSDGLGDKFSGLIKTAHGSYLFTSAPIRDESGQIVGGLMVGTRLETFLAELKSEALADIIILDADGRFMATTLVKPDEGYAMLELNPAALFPATTPPASGKSPLAAPPRDLPLYGRNFQAIYTPLLIHQEVAGILGIVLPNTYVAATEATSRNTFSLIFTLGTSAIILVGYLLSQSIARPILRLRAMAQAVAAGDLMQHSDLKRADEIGELGTAFDLMTQRLRERTAEAAQLYTEALQHNRELAETNAQLAESNARLQAAQRQLIQSEKLAAIGQLSAGIVHDVRNPLTVIRALAEILKEEEGLDPNWREQLETIRNNASRANTIISDLLKFARQSAPEFTYRDLRETVEAALRLTTYMARMASVNLVSELPPDPVNLYYDPPQIEQVLINLIQNAIHAMPRGGMLKVGLCPDGHAAAIRVQDTGIGIPPENLGRIFDPFFTTKPEGEGTGLGLSVGYGIISNHGGDINVESVVGLGTTFVVSLPLKRGRMKDEL